MGTLSTTFAAKMAPCSKPQHDFFLFLLSSRGARQTLPRPSSNAGTFARPCIVAFLPPRKLCFKLTCLSSASPFQDFPTPFFTVQFHLSLLVQVDTKSCSSIRFLQYEFTHPKHLVMSLFDLKALSLPFSCLIRPEEPVFYLFAAQMSERRFQISTYPTLSSLICEKRK